MIAMCAKRKNSYIHKDGECVFHHHGRYFAVKDWNLALLQGIKQAINILREGKK